MQLLHGRYEILEIIKSGGMGAVYEAKDTKLADSLCAVKEILEDKQNVLYFQTRFEQEMKMLAELDHPAIPRVRDFFRLRGKHYLVMDLVRGQSLYDELVEKGAGLAPEQVASDMVELLDVLDYLHGHSPPMIHRDIKPSNILRDRRSRQIKLVDFGLARTACGATQTAVGTLGYCAPEQSVGRADPRSDLYSVGATMLQLLTGQDPDMLKPEAQMKRIAPGLRPIIQRATRLKAQERYTSAREMAEDLRLHLRQGARAIDPEPQESHVVYVAATTNRWQGYATAAAIVLALALGTLLGRSEVAAPANTTPTPPVQAVVPQSVVPSAPTEEPVPSMPTATPAQMAEEVPPEPVVAPPRPKPVAAPAEIHPSLGANNYPTYQPRQTPEPMVEEPVRQRRGRFRRWFP